MFSVIVTDVYSSLFLSSPAQVQQWIEAVTGEAFDEDMSFAENLKDGTRLCNILNAYQPGMIRVGKPSKVGWIRVYHL